jgi:hypothetical protein
VDEYVTDLVEVERGAETIVFNYGKKLYLRANKES